MFTYIDNENLEFNGNHNIRLNLYFGTEEHVQGIYTSCCDIENFHEIADGLFVGHGDQVLSLRQLCNKAAVYISQARKEAMTEAKEYEAHVKSYTSPSV